MENLFFWLGTTGGFGIILLLTLTAAAVLVFFARDPRGENAWPRLIGPALAALALAVIAILAVRNYSTLLGVPPSDAASWALPVSYAFVAVIGLGWGLILRTRHPDLYAAVGLGARAVTTRLATEASR